MTFIELIFMFPLFILTGFILTGLVYALYDMLHNKLIEHANKKFWTDTYVTEPGKLAENFDRLLNGEPVIPSIEVRIE